MGKNLLVPMIFLVFSASNASAQSVATNGTNVPRPASNTLETPWKMSLTLGGSWYDGNAPLWAISGKLNVTYLKAPHELRVTVAGRYAMAKLTNVVENRLQVNIGYDHYLVPFLEAFLMGQGYFNPAKNISERYNVGGGLKFDFYKVKNAGELSLSTAYWPQYDVTILSPLPVWTHRMSFRLKTWWPLGKDVKVSGTAFWIPNLSDFFGDHRFEAHASVSVKVLKHLSLSLDFEDDYQSLVAPGFKNNDVLASVGVTLDL